VNLVFFILVELDSRADIHQALPSHFSFLAEFLILKVLFKDRDSRVLKLVNLSPGDWLFGLFFQSSNILHETVQCKQNSAAVLVIVIT
jgi:hypothetical protein